MSKLLKLKEWLTIEDAATNLSTLANELISPVDIVQFAIDGHINLSLYLLSPSLACIAEVIETPRELFGREVDFIPTKEQVLEEGRMLAYDLPKLMMLTHSDKRCEIRGLVDIAQLEATEFYLRMYRNISSGVPDECHQHIYVVQDSLTYQLYEPSFNLDGTFSGYTDATNIPEQAKLVVRTSELTKLQEIFGQSDTIGNRERNNLLRCIASLLWGVNIKPNDSSAVKSLVNVMKRGEFGSISEDTALKWIKAINNLDRKPRQ